MDSLKATTIAEVDKCEFPCYYMCTRLGSLVRDVTVSRSVYVCWANDGCSADVVVTLLA